MLSSQCVFDVKTDIISPIVKLVHEECNTKCDLDDDLDLRIVGQEQDGSLLYTWTGPSQQVFQDQDKEPGAVVTHVGLYDPIGKVNKTLFVHEKLVDIVNCSVSQDHSFLGFVTLEQILTSEGCARRQKQDKYQAYLAEVANPTVASRVFYLNLERSQYIRLQFLYGRYRGHVTRREAHLLVLLHGESVGLYHIPMARVGEDGVILSGEPKKEQIFQKRFVWWQWDATYQRLYVAQFRRQSKTLPGTQYRCYLTGYQFTEATVNEFMLDVPLDLPVPYLKSNSQRSHYEDPAPHQSIPDSAVHMYVTAQNNGTLCVCFQHPRTSSKGSKSSSPTSNSPTPSDDGEETTLQYSVAIVHHGKTLSCSGICIPNTLARRARLLFVMIGDYLLVHLEGCFTHLLNVSVDLQPCHHILWHEAVQPEEVTKAADDFKMSPKLLPLVWDRHGSIQPAGAMAYDPITKRGYKLTVSQDALFSFFRTAPTSAARLAILHYAVVHHRDLAFNKKLFESLVCEPTSFEMVGLFEEFLVGSTYTALRRQMELYVMRYIPFTCAAPCKGQTEMDSEGNQLCKVNYVPLGSVAMGNLAKVKSDHNTAEMWSHLEGATKNLPLASRFSSQSVQRFLETTDEDDPEFVKIHSAEVPSLFRKLATAAKSALSSNRAGTESMASAGRAQTQLSSRSELLLGPPPNFLSDTPQSIDHHQEQLISVTSDMLATHLRKFLKRDSRNKIRCIASEYIECQMQQSRLLVHLLCSLLMPDDIPDQQTLDMVASPAEHELFFVMERYHMAVEQQGFPHPPGFPLFFICLAFRCLRRSVFSQYVENQVVQPTRRFMEKLLTELPDTTETVSLKLDVLRQLPPDVGLSCARLWSHPISRRFLATHYTEACLTDGEKEEFAPVYKEKDRNKEDATGAVGHNIATKHGEDFPPLATLLNAMERKVSKQVERGKSGPKPLDRQLIQEASMAELYNSGYQRDDIITFG